MNTEKRINLYIGNHGKLIGIEDYILFVGNLCQSRGVSFTFGRAFREDSVNIVIDEFSNLAENRKLANFKRLNPSATLVGLLTEFPTRKFGVESFNLFGGLYEATLAFFARFFFRFTRNDLGNNRVTDFLRLPTLILLLPEVAFDFFVSSYRYIRFSEPFAPLERFVARNFNIFYMQLRYLGFRAVSHHFDFFLKSHDEIKSTLSPKQETASAERSAPRVLGTIYPEIRFDESSSDPLEIGRKNLMVEITGSVTAYRKRWIKRINRRIRILGLHRSFDYCQAISFSKDNSISTSKSMGANLQDPMVSIGLNPLLTKIRGAFSLHPPQTSSWLYASPTRLFRAIQVDRNIPVITKHFNQHPIEDVALLWDTDLVARLYDIYSDPTEFLTEFSARIDAYNRCVRPHNDRLLDEIFEKLI